MKFSSNRLFAGILIAILLAGMNGCDNSSAIVGSWRALSDPDGMIWQFSKDGSIMIGKEQGRYTLGDRGRIKIDTPFASAVYRVELSTDKMVLVDPKGSRLEFVRIKPGGR